MDWEDLKAALALARAGSVRQAARGLGVSHSTVLRRLRSLEKAMGVRLFQRTADGYEATPAGQDVFDTATRLEETVLGLERRVTGRDFRLSGPVRVTLPGPFAPLVLPILGDFAREHSGIEVTVSLDEHYVDLAHRAADVAIRAAPAPPPDLVGHRVCLAGVAVYGAADYLRDKTNRRLEELDWVGWDASSTMYFAEWTRKNAPAERVVLRVSAGREVQAAVDAGVGVAITASALGEVLPNWRRVVRVPEAAVPLWVLTHRDLRTTTRVRVLRDFVVAGLRKRRAVIEGTCKARRD